MNKKLKRWREDGKYLPDIMRDFHDQKELFKTMYEMVDVESHQYAGHIKWVDGHCYVVDIFLWFMARHGYTIQKNRSNIEFEDLQKAIEECSVRRFSHLSSILTSIDETPKA